MHITTRERWQAQGRFRARIARLAAWSTVLGAVAAATLVGCTRHPSRTTPTPILSAPTSGANAANERAIAAYRGMWQAYAEAGRTSNPDDLGLSVYAIGNALKALQVGLETNKKQGLITTGKPIASPQVTSITPAAEPDSAEVSDCLDTTDFRRTKADGTPFTDSPGGRRAVKATLKKINNQWKVTDFLPGEVGSC